MWIKIYCCILSINIWKGSYNLIIMQNYYYSIQKYFYIHWVTLLCTMGDNPYKYCNLQWEIIHTLLSCDNIFFVHVLHVLSLVLFCLLMIVQCLDFKSINVLLLLLLIIIWNRHGLECSRIWKLSGNFIKKCRDFLGRDILGTTFF